MKYIHNYFRILSEARLCHMDGSQGRGPDQPEPQAIETKAEQPEGEASMKIEDADSSKSVGDKAQDAMDKRTGDLGQALADMGKTQDAGKSVDAASTDTKPDAKQDNYAAMDATGMGMDENGLPLDQPKAEGKPATTDNPDAKPAGAAGNDKVSGEKSPDFKKRTPRGNKEKRDQIRKEDAAVKAEEKTDDKDSKPATAEAKKRTPRGNKEKRENIRKEDEAAKAEGKTDDTDSKPAAESSGDTTAVESKDNNAGEKPAEEKKEDAVEGAKDAAADAVEAAGDKTEKSDVQNALSKLGEAAKGKDFGAFLAALKEVMDSIKTIFKPEEKKDDAKNAPNTPGINPDSKGNTPNVGPSAGPTEGGNKPTEAAGEKPSDRTDRLKKEVSDAGSVVEFKKNKEQSRDQQMQDFDKQIDDEQSAAQTLDTANDGLKQQVADAEQKISDPRTKPEEKATLEKSVRDLKVDISANDQKIDHNKKDIQELTTKRNEVFANTERDIKEVDGMLKKATDGKASIDKMLTGMRETKDLTTNEDMKTLLAGITVDVVESKLDIGISLSDPAKAALDNLVKQAGGSTEGVFGPGGVVQNTEKLQAAIAVAVTDIAKKAQAEAKKA